MKPPAPMTPERDRGGAPAPVETSAATAYAPRISFGPGAFAYIRDLVYRHSSILLADDQEWLVESRLTPVAFREGARSVEELLSRMQRGTYGRMHLRAVEAMLNNETTFFRDLYPFQALQNEVLPRLLERRESDRRLHIWCGACASGQEPYSIAMLLREGFPRLADWRVRLVATDVSAAMVRRVREGRYSQFEINRGLPASLLVKYFEKLGDEWRINDQVRSMVECYELNLVSGLPDLVNADIIFLRNVLIYFDVATRTAVLERIRRILRPDGCLFLGAAETTLSLSTCFEAQRTGRVVWYRPSS